MAYRKFIVIKSLFYVLVFLFQGCHLNFWKSCQVQLDCQDVINEKEIFILDGVTFKSDRNKVLCIDLSNRNLQRQAQIDNLFWPDKKTFIWCDEELKRVAKEIILLKMRGLNISNSSIFNCQDVPIITVCILGQEYVTDGKDSRPTDFYAICVKVEIRIKQAEGWAVLVGEGTARTYTCWGTASYSPLTQEVLYRMFSEALHNALYIAVSHDTANTIHLNTMNPKNTMGSGADSKTRLN